MIDVVCLNPAMDRTLVLDSFTKGAVHRAKECHVSPGGKGVNVARFIKQVRPRTDVRVHGFAGGVIGDYIRDALMQNGIKDALTQIQGETRICSIVVAKAESTVFNESGPRIVPSEIETFLNSLKDDATLAVISGSAPEGTPSDIYRDVIRHYQRHQIPVYLDTSGLLLSEALTERPTLVKVNHDELQALMRTGMTGNGVTANEDTGDGERGGVNAIRWLAMAVQEARQSYHLPHLIVTMGSQGAVLASESVDPIWFRPMEIHAVNPTASGDAFLAGLVDGMLQTGDITQATHFAMSAAALNTVSLTSNLSDVSLYEPWARRVTSMPLSALET